MSKTDQLQHHNPDAHPTYLASLPTHLEPPSSLKSTTVDTLKYPIPLHGYLTRNIETPVSGITRHYTTTRNPTQELAETAANTDSHETTTVGKPTCAATNCSSPGLLKCTRCKNTVYCSRSCQSVHWSSHRSVCIPPAPSPPPPHADNTSSPFLPQRTQNTPPPSLHPCLVPSCTQRASITCNTCLATLYCSKTCEHRDALTHACLCPAIQEVSVNRRWKRLRAGGWEPHAILTLADRFAVPALSASEKFDIIFGDDECSQQLVEEAVRYTGLPKERIHKIAIESTPEELSRLGYQLYGLREKAQRKQAPRRSSKKCKQPSIRFLARRPDSCHPGRKLMSTGSHQIDKTPVNMNPMPHPSTNEEDQLMPQTQKPFDSRVCPGKTEHLLPSPQPTDIVSPPDDGMDPNYAQDSTEPDPEQATETDSTKTEETPDAIPPNYPTVSMVPAPSQDSMDTPTISHSRPSAPHTNKSMTARRKKNKSVYKKQYCKKKMSQCLYFTQSPKSRLGLCKRKNVIHYCIYCKWSSLTIPLPRCGVG